MFVTFPLHLKIVTNYLVKYASLNSSSCQQYDNVRNVTDSALLMHETRSKQCQSNCLKLLPYMNTCMESL